LWDSPTEFKGKIKRVSKYPGVNGDNQAIEPTMEKLDKSD
jgi:hypothetical protein